MFCNNCGTQIPENTHFCPKCGQTTQKTNISTAPVNQQSNNLKKLHCPNCKSHNVQVTTESSVTGAVTTHHGGFSTSHVSNNHQTFWVCSDCGTKFRNIQSLEEEISKCKNTHIVLFVFSAICAALFLFFFTKSQSNPLGGFLFGAFIFGSAIGAIMFLISGFISKKKVKEMRAELEYLKINCFN